MLILIHNAYPQFFVVDKWRFCYKNLSHIFKRLYVWSGEVVCAKSDDYFRRNQWKLYRKLENVVTTSYETISNINKVFFNSLQIRYKFAIFFTLDDNIDWKMPISVINPKWIVQRFWDRHLNTFVIHRNFEWNKNTVWLYWVWLFFTPGKKWNEIQIQ